MTQRRVLVTGGSGFIAGHVILALQRGGYAVRTTVRSLAKEQAVRDALARAGMRPGDRLEVVAADLLADDGWPAAVDGVDAVLHVASPVATEGRHSEESVVRPAREGTLRVLRAARDAGVRRVVATSAFHAVGFGQPHDHPPFTEADWSPLDGPGMDAYGRSKVLAERAAWDFVRREGRGMELVTLLPVAVMGPVLGGEVSGANAVVRTMLRGGMPGLPDLAIPIVDVRDVAAAHVAAVTAPAVAGERVLVATGEPATPMREIAAILTAEFGADAAKVQTRRIPDLVVRMMGVASPAARAAAADLGFVKRIDVTRMRRDLGIEPRPSRDAVVAAAASLLQRRPA